MEPKTILLAGMILMGIVYFVFWFTTVARQRAATGDHSSTTPQPITLGISFVANFLDTLGIGSYATTTSMFRSWSVVRDEKIPGTLNVGYVLPTLVQALIYITIGVEFDRARRSRHTSRPFFFGSITSRITRSGSKLAALWRPSSPSAAVSTS